VTPRRGEIWLVDFGEPVGREQAGIRPAVIVSTDALNEGHRESFWWFPSRRRGVSFHHTLRSSRASRVLIFRAMPSARM
jgi:mRNA interferase MazF